EPQRARGQRPDARLGLGEEAAVALQLREVQARGVQARVEAQRLAVGGLGALLAVGLLVELAELEDEAPAPGVVRGRRGEAVLDRAAAVVAVARGPGEEPRAVGA